MAERIDTVYRGPSRFPTIYHNPHERHPLQLPSGEVVEGVRATVFHKITAINSPQYALPQLEFKEALMPGLSLAEDRFWGAVSRLCTSESTAIRMKTVYGEKAEPRLFLEASPEVWDIYQIGLRGYLDREVSAVVPGHGVKVSRTDVVSFLANSSIFGDAPNKQLVEEIVIHMLKTMIKGAEHKPSQKFLDPVRVGVLGALGYSLVDKLRSRNFIWDDGIEGVEEIIGDDGEVTSKDVRLATIRSLKAARYITLPDYVVETRPGKDNVFKDDLFTETVLPPSHPLKNIIRPVENLLKIEKEILGVLLLEDIGRLREVIQPLVQGAGVDRVSIDRIVSPKIKKVESEERVDKRDVVDSVWTQKMSILRGALFSLDFVRWRRTGEIRSTAGAADTANYVNYDLGLQALEKGIERLQQETGRDDVSALEVVGRAKLFIKKAAGVE